MKKSGGKNYFFWILMLVLIFIVAFLSFKYFNFTGNVVAPITAPSDCSEQQIKALWDTIFKEGSVGILFNNSLGAGNCAFAALKKVGSEVYFLNYTDSPVGFSGAKVVSASHGNFTAEYANILESQFASNYSFVENSLNSIRQGGLTLDYLIARNINSLAQAETTFNLTYKNLNLPSFEVFSTFNGLNSAYVDDSGNDSSTNISFAGNAQVAANYSYETYYLSLTNILNTNCTPNWTRQESACLSNETKTVSYNDTNSCGNSVGQIATTNIFCDYDLNGIVGDVSSLGSDYNFSVYISGSQLNNSLNYSANSTQQFVQIQKDGVTIISFSHNFSSSPMNLKDATIKLNSASSDFGYIIINGIGDDKTVYFDKKNSFSGQVCIKDETVPTISNVSDDCEEDDEYLINCPGSSGGYNCTITNNTFTVIGLEHSAVKEIVSTTCLANWSCSDWSNCTNSIKTRTCVDANSCNTTFGRPTLSENCTVVCFPTWTCTEWTPEKCSADENQTRVCTDAKGCNTQSGKPKETQICENPTKSIPWLLIAIGAVILVIIIVLIILMLNNKKSSQQPPSDFSMQPQYPQSPRPMAPPMQPVPQQRQYPPRQMQQPMQPVPQQRQYPSQPNPNFNNQPQN